MISDFIQLLTGVAITACVVLGLAAIGTLLLTIIPMLTGG